MRTLGLMILTMSMAACGSAGFTSRPQASNLTGNKAAAASTTADATASSDSPSVSGTESSITPAQAAADAKAKQLAELDPAAVAAAEKCPGLDPVLIDKLIKTGQPFEVECEVEIEVGPDAD